MARHNRGSQVDPKFMMKKRGLKKAGKRKIANKGGRRRY
jgi:hypothetical protein